MKNLIFPILLAALLFSCKKKENSTNTSNGTASTTGGSPTGGNVVVPAGLSLTSGGDMCNLQTTIRYFDDGVTITRDTMAFASFYSSAPGSNPPQNVPAGTVTLNGYTIPFDNSINSYYSGIPFNANITGQLQWSVSGSGTVTAFNQSFIPSYPKYTGASALPDTCIKANGLSVNINGVSNNANSVVVYLSGNNGFVMKYILGNSGTINFSSSELNDFSQNQPFFINVSLTNLFTATHGGIKRGFSNNLSYARMCYMK